MRLRRIVLAGAGLVLVTLERLWRMRQSALRERTTTRHVIPDKPDAIPAEAQTGDEQLPGDGSGPLVMRRYRADIANPSRGAEELIADIKANLPDYSPSALADFTKSQGWDGAMKIGDEYDIAILGPWNGSVRVIAVEPRAFAFITLTGHPEAGEIRFSLEEHPAQTNALRFEIVSWARSRDDLVHLAYSQAKIGREVQKNVWVTFCERVVEASGGELIGEIDVLTEEHPFKHEVVPNE